MNNQTQTTVIAIDGPAGAGKSSVAKHLSKVLGFAYLDTGAMYRAVTLKGMEQGLDLTDEEKLAELAKNSKIKLTDDNGTARVFIDGKDVSEAIRTVEVTNNTFYAARAPKVRAIMVAMQQQMGSKDNVIVEGRDTTTVVFPEATYKFYLDADLEERSNRRRREYEAKGDSVDKDKLQQELKERDHKDTSRAVGALKIADDAIYIDTNGMTVEDTAEAMLKHINL